MCCCRRLLRAPWTARRSSWSILKEISPEYSLEGLMLKFQYFGHLRWSADSLGQTLTLGKIEGRRRRGPQKMRWLDSTTDSVDVNFLKPWEMVKDREAWCAAVRGVTESDSVDPRLPASPSPLPRWQPHFCFLHLWLYCCSANKLICTF